MPIVVGVKFNNNRKVYHFDPEENVYVEGDIVVVETQKGNELGEVVKGNFEVPEEEAQKELKKVVRKANSRDFDLQRKAKETEPRALEIAREKARNLGLSLKFISSEVSFDCKRVVLCFTSEDRVDFRELVKELASALHARIELRQLYERDDVKLRGSLGMCGRECCCRSYLRDFEKVTVKMAKVQGLSLNPTKISGICGKLMCCLKYENEYYSEVFKQMPKVNAKVMTPDGMAVVDSNDMLKKIVTCKVFVDDTYVMKKFPLDQITVLKPVNNPPHGKKKDAVHDEPDEDGDDEE
ncbi:MAG TPA: stage 0 sporulation protein [Clostridiales bacterium]|nr:stage 0 sporulation protein [Clostridiales bacterium]